MPSTYLSLHYHLVFSTRDRQPIIDPLWQPRFYTYIGGIVNKLGGIPNAIGGTDNHVHLLIGLQATHKMCDVLQEIKQTSSYWVNSTFGLNNFAWQKGYGAFSVSQYEMGKIKEYIAQQPEHHQQKSFEQEYLEVLQDNGIKYDERYLW